MNLLRVSIIQSPIFWEDKAANLAHFKKKLTRLAGKSDLAILPETFSTGFSMKTAELAETMDGETISTLKEWAKKFDLAITGSFIAKEGDAFFNRGFFVTPEGKCHTTDKRHLFRMGKEHHTYTPGNSRECFHYRGWNIRLLICYDLRFPVWSRNINNSYDLLIYVANWPAPRSTAWKKLLPARALENMAFVCGVNRVGLDGNNLAYSGDSAIHSPKGEKLLLIPAYTEAVRTRILNKEEIDKLREKFPVWKDADSFYLED